jgi:hypothetical protein
MEGEHADAAGSEADYGELSNLSRHAYLLLQDRSAARRC